MIFYETTNIYGEREVISERKSDPFFVSGHKIDLDDIYQKYIDEEASELEVKGWFKKFSRWLYGATPNEQVGGCRNLLSGLGRAIVAIPYSIVTLTIGTIISASKATNMNIDQLNNLEAAINHEIEKQEKKIKSSEFDNSEKKKITSYIKALEDCKYKIRKLIDATYDPKQVNVY